MANVTVFMFTSSIFKYIYKSAVKFYVEFYTIFVYNIIIKNFLEETYYGEYFTSVRFKKL